MELAEGNSLDNRGRKNREEKQCERGEQHHRQRRRRSESHGDGSLEGLTFEAKTTEDGWSNGSTFKRGSQGGKGVSAIIAMSPCHSRDRIAKALCRMRRVFQRRFRKVNGVRRVPLEVSVVQHSNSMALGTLVTRRFEVEEGQREAKVPCTCWRLCERSEDLK